MFYIDTKNYDFKGGFLNQFLGEVLKNNFRLGQNIVEKFTKLSKTGFCKEYFTADFLWFPVTNVKICRGQLGTQYEIKDITELDYNTFDQIQAFQGFSGNFAIS